MKKKTMASGIIPEELKLSKAEVLELSNISRERMRLYPAWRVGQAYFNILYELHPRLADIIRGSKLDPFYDTRRINDFLDNITR